MRTVSASLSLAACALLLGSSALATPAGERAFVGQHSSTGDRSLVRTVSGSVGPDFTISMSRNRTVRGLYQITVRDRSEHHNFHFTGPGGVNRRTTVPFVGTRVWTVRLRPGTYRYVCDPHSDVMRGTLRVFRPAE